MHNPLYRRTFVAAKLLREYPPRLCHDNKRALFKLAYPDGQAAPGPIEVTRWAAHVPQPLELSATLAVEVQPDFYDYRPAESASPAVEWHVNFADSRLFVAYGSGLFAQDEMQVAEHPLLGSVREALLAEGLAAKTRDETGPTPILVRNVERRIEVSTEPDAAAGRPAGLYGNRFADATPDDVRRATRQITPPTLSNIIAMTAPSDGSGEYTAYEIEYIFTAACTAFAAAQHETIAAQGAATRTVVHTGFWGCGAFGGNRTLMVALQVLAARAAQIDCLVIHAGNAAGVSEAQGGLDVAEGLALRCGTACTLDAIADQFPSLGLDDVYTVLGYYFRHRDAVEEYLGKRRSDAEEVRRANESRFAPAGIRDRLMARRRDG
jgi:hypothetical protein